MDVVGSLGYIGQEIQFLDGERFAHVTGNSMCIYDTLKGPREMIWRTSTGIYTFSTNFETQTMAVAPKAASAAIELISTQDYSTKTTIETKLESGVVNLAFSRDGERLLALTDNTDHRLLVWKLGDNPDQLLSHKLDTNVRVCSVNPCKMDNFFIYGDDGLSVGQISNVMGKHKIKLNFIDLDSASKDHANYSEQGNGNSINFALWIPGNRILVGNSFGLIFCISVEDRSITILGSCLHPNNLISGRTEKLIASCATLSVQHIIIGTKEGIICWYPFNSLGGHDSIIDFHNAVQFSQLDKPINVLSTDMNFTMIVIGTSSGRLLKIPLDIQEANMIGYDEADADLQSDGAVEKKKLLESTKATLISSDTNNGVILCAKYLSIDVQKFSSRSRSSLSMFLTASHKGIVTFWRHSVQAIEPMVTGGGIRRSTPRVVHAPLQVFISGRRDGAAICSIEFVHMPMKHLQILCLGFADGTVELWSIEAHENEDEDVKDVTGDSSSDEYVRFIEDDEGACVVRFEMRRMYFTKVFHSAVSFLKTFTSKTGDLMLTRLAIASDTESDVFVLPLLKNEQLTFMDGISSSIFLGNDSRPRSIAVHEDMLYFFCDGGAIVGMRSSEVSGSQTKKIFTSGLETIVGASFAESSAMVILLSNSNLMYTFPVRSLNQEKGVIANRSGFKYYEHSDIVFCVAHAPNGRYFATGCLNGAVHIWKVDADDFDIYLANCLHLHASAVASMAFSADSSLLMSCGVDGSSFILTLDRPSLSTASKMIARGSVLSDDSLQYFSDLLPPGAVTVAADTVENQASTWAERRNMEMVKEVKAQHRFKAMGITAAIGEISQRLQVLITQNDQRTELERLERSEFVIDIDRRDEFVQSNSDQVNSTINMYTKKNLCNELRSARIRQKCWDPIEIKSKSLLPFFSTNCRKGLSVSSFSIDKVDSARQTYLRKVKRLRAIELRCQQATPHCGTVTRLSGTPYYRSTWSTVVSGCPANISWISNDGARWPVSDKIATLLEAQKAGEQVVAKEKEGVVNKDKANDSSTVEGEEDDATSINSFEDEVDIDETHVLNLLYPPQAVRTQVQKRMQIILLKDVVRQIRMKFNECFDKLQSEKEDIIGSIESRNTRIRSILEDLRQTEDLFCPKMANSEVPNSAVCVTIDELTSRPYESDAARAQRLQEEEEKRRRELEKDKNDVKGRALDEMMHGTLEVKRDVFADSNALAKPEWMDSLSTSEMNEAQLKEYDAYQTKIKALQEEQANYRKSLEQEMKKLKIEIADLCKNFDEKLEELSDLKVLVHREIISHEIYVARIAFSMARMEQARKFIIKSEKNILALRQERSDIRSTIDQLNGQMEEMKVRIGSIQEDERQMDKTFRRDLQNLCNKTFDQDSLKVFTQLYRRRTYPRGGYDASADNYNDQSEVDISNSVSQKHRRSKDASSKGGRHGRSQSKRTGLSSSTAGDGRTRKLRASKGVSAGGRDSALGPMQQAAQALRSPEETNSNKEKDPFYESLLLLEKKKLTQEAQIPIVSPLSMEMDCPEGFVVDQFSWSKLQELRNARIEKEIAGKRLSIDFAELKKKLDLLEAEEIVLAGCIADLKDQRDETLISMADLECNQDLVVCLRQGQDEVDKDAVVTDYSDALLLPVTALHKYNSRIKELGKEKINILSKIKLFRRKINLIDWEAKHHGMEARHYEAYLTDLQLFRVTRELQKVIREGTDSHQFKERLDKVSQRRDYLMQDADLKLQAIKKANEVLVRQLDDRQQECDSLEKSISELHSQVSLSKSVKLSRDEARGGGGDALSAANAKMKKIVSRRHMVDTARAQAEEIDYLRQELDKMRQRTFPSFVRATRKRLTVHPDGL